jgi:hypothetical protein
VLGVVNPPPEIAPRRRALVLRTVIRLGCFLALAIVVGAAAGVAWWAVVDLPAYRVNSDGGAATTERGLSEFISGDAWFAAIGVVVGVGLGLAGWRWLRRLGWSVVLVVAFAAVTAELVCWLVGYRLGPGDFAPRLAAAKPGDLVPIALTLRARASLLTWPFFAVIPILLGSSLGRDDEEPRPIFPRRARS